MSILFLISIFFFNFTSSEEIHSKRQGIDKEIRESLKIRKVLALPRIETDSKAIYELGKRLFHETSLSGNKRVSCASCHQKSRGLGTGTMLPKSIFYDSSTEDSKKYLPRNAPPLYNLAFKEKLFWDGRVQLLKNGELVTPEARLNERDPLGKKILSAIRSGGCLKVSKKFRRAVFAKPKSDSKGCVSVEHIAALTLFPLSDPFEMRGKTQGSLSRVEYWKWLGSRMLTSEIKELVREAFPHIKNTDEINIGHLARALAEFLILEFQSIDSPLDRYIGTGDDSALSLEEKKGALVFFSDQARCTRCHTGPLLSDSRFHSVAIPQFGPGVENGDDFGAYNKNSDEHLYAFRTPSLRNLSQTSPYMHNGAFSKIGEVISFYNDIFPSLMSYKPPRHPATTLNFKKNKKTYVDRLTILNSPIREPLGLSPDQVKHLETFLLKSLTDSEL